MDSDFRIGDYIQILKRRYLYLVIPFVVLFTGSVGVATILPPVYESTGVILIESPQISREIVAGAIDIAARERIEVIKQRVMTRANLIRIANEFGVFRNSDKKLSSTEIVEQMRGKAFVDFISTGTSSRTQTTIAFRVSFQDRSPNVTARVANEIVTLFMDENVKTRTKIATETTDFLNREAKKLEDHLAEIEARIANYKQENASALPENLNIRIDMRERTEGQIRETDREIKAHEEELRFLDIQLSAFKSGFSQVDVPIPQAVPMPGAAAPEVQPFDTTHPELKRLKDEFDEASAKYSPSHPDVKRLSREIEAVEERLINEGGPTGVGVEISRLETRVKDAEQRGDSAQVKSLQDEINRLKDRLIPKISESVDPRVLHQQQQISIAQAQAKAQAARMKTELELNIRNIETKIGVTQERILSLREQKESLVKRLEDIESSIVQTPLVDRALKALNRDYENAQQKYNEVRAKAMEAQISENVEEASKAERFVLVEPPTLPDEPIKPNRNQLVLLGFALSLGVGVAGIFGIEFVDGSIRGVSGLTGVLNEAPLAAIPYIVTAKEDRGKMRARLALLIGACLMMFGALALVHFAYMPLDDVFYKVLDRFS